MRIHILRKDPGEPARMVEIENTLEELQAQVGGYIEAVTFATDAAVICNEEGRLLGLPDNCTIFGVGFVGTVLLVGVDGEDFASLPGLPGAINRYKNMFRYLFSRKTPAFAAQAEV